MSTQTEERIANYANYANHMAIQKKIPTRATDFDLLKLDFKVPLEGYIAYVDSCIVNGCASMTWRSWKRFESRRSSPASQS